MSTFYAYYPPTNIVTATIVGPVTVNQGTSPWIVSGTVVVSNFPTTVDTNYGIVGVNTIRTAAQIGNSTGAAAFGAGSTTAQTLRVVLPTDQSAIPVTQGTSPWVVSGTVTANQGTSPWIVSGTTTISGPVTVNQGTSPWVVSGTVAATQSGVWTTGRTWTLSSGIDSVSAVQSGTWNIGTLTSITNPVTVNQGTSPWVVSGTTTISGPVTVSNFPTTVDTNYGTVGANTIRTASQIGNSTGAANFGAGTTTAQTLRVVLPTDQTAIPVTQSGAWTVTANQGTSPWVDNLTQVGGSAITLGQKAAANSLPVVSQADEAPATQNITTQDVSSVTTAVANGQNFITGTPTAGSAATFTIASFESVEVIVKGTWTGTLSTEVSIDGGVTWSTRGIKQSGAAYISSTFTANFSGGSNIAGVTNYRVRSTAVMTGTATVKIVTTINPTSITVTNPITLRDSTTQSIANTIKASSTLAVSTDTALVTTMVASNTPGAVAAAQSVQVAGSDGTDTRTLLTDATGKLQISSTTANSIQNAPIDGVKATYSASFYDAASTATNSTDFFSITGSATKTVRILEWVLTGDRTTSSAVDILLIKRSTASTGGTGFPITYVPHDSNNAAATTEPVVWTISPTLGTAVGSPVRAERMFLNAVATGMSDKITWTFGSNPGQAIVLRGTAQSLNINLNAVTILGGSFDMHITWTEE